MLFLFNTLGTEAALGFDVLIPVFFAVVVAEFFSWSDIFDRGYVDSPRCCIGFTIRTTRVVDVASDVLACGAIDMTVGRCFKKVSPTAPVGFSSSDDFSEVFDDALTFFDWYLGKESEAVDTTFDDEIVRSFVFGDVFAGSHERKVYLMRAIWRRCPW